MSHNRLVPSEPGRHAKTKAEVQLAGALNSLTRATGLAHSGVCASQVVSVSLQLVHAVLSVSTRSGGWLCLCCRCPHT